MKHVLLTPNDKFSYWTVISQSDSTHYLCECICGKQRVVLGARLLRGAAKSCGCQQSHYMTHGANRNRMETPTYTSWRGMKARCLNQNDKRFSRYGGRGIKVCSRWRHSFLNFLHDMGERPKGMTLDRIDRDGDYEPGNCRWTTVAEQNRNSSKVKLDRAQINMIREMCRRSVPIREVATTFGITCGYVYKIKDMVAWG